MQQSAEQHVTEVLSKFKLAMKHYNISTIDGYFKMDKDNNFVISIVEFGETLKQVDPTLTAFEIQIAYNRFDTNKSGTIDFSEFSSAIDKIQLPEAKTYQTKEQIQQKSQEEITQQQLDQLRKDAATAQSLSELAVNKLKQAVIYYKIDVYSLFRKYDVSQDGVLDVNEFGRLILQMEPNLLITDIIGAFSFFDRDQNYSVSVQEFLDVVNA